MKVTTAFYAGIYQYLVINIFVSFGDTQYNSLAVFNLIYFLYGSVQCD